MEYMYVDKKHVLYTQKCFANLLAILGVDLRPDLKKQKFVLQFFWEIAEYNNLYQSVIDS